MNSQRGVKKSVGRTHAVGEKQVSWTNPNSSKSEQKETRERKQNAWSNLFEIWYTYIYLAWYIPENHLEVCHTIDGQQCRIAIIHFL